MTEKTPPLLSMLQRLPPSKELLEFYHKKLEQYVDEEKRWLKRLANTKKAVDQSAALEQEVFAQKREITALQKAVTDMREALTQERKINHKLYAENDKLRIKELEDRRKVVACLELCGKSDREVTKMLDNADKRGDLGNLVIFHCEFSDDLSSFSFMNTHMTHFKLIFSFRYG